MHPDDRRYIAEHQWIKRDSAGHYVIGITSFAQEQLGDVSSADLPQAGTRVEQGMPFGVVESLKTASDVFAPISGEVVEVNRALGDAPELVNDDPYGEGWLIAIMADEPSGFEQLLSVEQYAELTEA